MVTKAGNQLNRSKHRGGLCRYLGVSRHTSTGRWYARSECGGVRRVSVHCDTARAAAIERDRMMVETYGALQMSAELSFAIRTARTIRHALSFHIPTP